MPQSHPLIKGFLGVEDYVLTLEYAEGERLGAVLRNGERNKNHDLRKLHEVYGLLGYNIAYLSKRGLIHGHLHTDNIVVTAENKPVIIDWGMASYFTD